MVNNKAILKAVIKGLKKGDFNVIAPELNRTLSLAVSQGRLGPDFDQIDLIDGRVVYANILTAAGLLEKRGGTMTTVHYVPTERGKEVYRKVWS